VFFKPKSIVMSNYAERSKEKSTATVSQAVQKTKSEAPFQFVDNRPRAIVQQKMQEALYSSNRVSQLMNNGRPIAAQEPDVVQRVLNPGAAVFVPAPAPAPLRHHRLTPYII
jgi:hypothetical protein